MGYKFNRRTRLELEGYNLATRQHSVIADSYASQLPDEPGQVNDRVPLFSHDAGAQLSENLQAGGMASSAWNSMNPMTSKARPDAGRGSGGRRPVERLLAASLVLLLHLAAFIGLQFGFQKESPPAQPPREISVTLLAPPAPAPPTPAPPPEPRIRQPAAAPPAPTPPAPPIPARKPPVKRQAEARPARSQARPKSAAPRPKPAVPKPQPEPQPLQEQAAAGPADVQPERVEPAANRAAEAPAASPPSTRPPSAAVPSAAPPTAAPPTAAPPTAAPPSVAPATGPKTITSGVEYLRPPKPRYPPLSRRLGEEGNVVLRVLINAQGQAERIEVMQSSKSVLLDEAAREAVRAASFKPYLENGTPVPVFAVIPITFRLKE